MAYVYQHIRLDTNEVFYIGIGSDTAGKYSRANAVKGRKNPYWNRIVNKVGHRVEILKDGMSWEDACEEERRLIKLYGRFNLNEGNLVNLTDGGDGNLGWIPSNEVKDKIRQSIVGHTHSEETKRKISENSKGRILSIETKSKMSEYRKLHKIKPPNHKGLKRSEETKRKISEGKKGKLRTEEQRKRMSEGMRGKKLSESHKQHIKESHIRRRINNYPKPIPHLFF